jgi:hypothetical protein
MSSAAEEHGSACGAVANGRVADITVCVFVAVALLIRDDTSRSPHEVKRYRCGTEARPNVCVSTIERGDTDESVELARQK